MSLLANMHIANKEILSNELLVDLSIIMYINYEQESMVYHMKTVFENGKMLITSIFPLSHNVFYPLIKQMQHI